MTFKYTGDINNNIHTNAIHIYMADSGYTHMYTRGMSVWGSLQLDFQR